MIELFKDIVGYEGLYAVSNLGNIKSYGENQKYKKPVKILKLIKSKRGYLVVGLGKDGVIKIKLIHRLISLAFIPNHENKPHINHKNGIKTDNRIENLEWCTHAENMKHSYTIGRKSVWSGIYGADHCGAKAVIATDKQGNIKRFKSAIEASAFFGVSYKNTTKAARGGLKTIKGHALKYVV